jgi:uncharacterized protein YcfJ
MNTTLQRSLDCAALLLAFAPLIGHAQSQEMARVVSSTPVVTQVAAPQQVCTQSQVIMAAPKSGAGALLGAVAGGAIGSQVGGGSGRALATAAGMIGGAIAGDSMEAAPPPVYQPVSSCTQQVSYENRVTAYNVVYEYAGKQYSIQLPNDPGPYLPVRISPSVAAAPAVVATPPVVAPAVVNPPVLVTPAYPAAYPSVYPPVYYAPPVYYGAPAVSFRWSYGSGWGGSWGGHPHHRHQGHRHHRDWR